MIRKPQGKLLVNLLNQQVDAGDGDGLSEARIEQALTTGPDFSSKERHLLWQAPVARNRLFRIRNRLRDDILERWRTAGIQPIAQLRAAADDSQDVTKVTGDGFSVTIYTDPDPDMPWVLSLQIDARLLEAWPRGVKLRLIDSGGKVWLTGHPNSRGEINDGWHDKVASPFDRLLKYDLCLEPR